MDIRDFIEKLRQSHFFLVNENGQLILRGDKTRLNEQQIRNIRDNNEIIDFIKKNKAGIIEWLSSAKNKLPDTHADNVAAIYPLSSLQEGILFQVLYDGTGNAYVQQASCDFEGLNVNVFKQTWEYLIRKHTILRTGIHHDVFRMPVQCVYNHVSLPMEEVDLRPLSGDEQHKLISRYKEDDAQRGFTLKEAPLMRITLFRCSEEHYHMLWTTHHLILDGWSVQALVGGFLEMYEKYLNGTPQQTGVDAYEEYIRFIQQQDGDRATGFWQSYMEGADRGCLLPFVEPRAERTKGVDLFKEKVLVLDEASTRMVQLYVQRNQITVNTLMQGLWATLLTDYTGNTDVMFGVVTHGRPQELKDIEKRVGMYTNILPLRVSLDGATPFHAELCRLQQQQLPTQQYQYTALNSIRDLSAVSGELFDTILSFQNFPVSETVAAMQSSLRVTNVQVSEQSTNYPLCIRIQAGKEIGIEFIYRESLIDKHWIEAISSHFNKVLLQVIASDSLLTRDVDPLTKDDKISLLEYGHPSSDPFPAVTDIVTRFDEQAAKSPSAIALACGSIEWTYATLQQRADRVAAWLIEQGVQPGEHVGVCMQRSDLLILAILGVLKAGSAYVPIDPSYPVERINYMIQDSGISRLLMVKEPVWQTTAQLLVLNEQTPLPVAAERRIRISPDATAYLMYTSGSTGIPKGVIVSHNNVVSLVKEVSYVTLSPGQVLLSTGSPSFDAVTFEYWSMLLNGGRLVMCSEETLLDPVLLKAEIRRQQVTMMWFTAGWFNKLVDDDIDIFATLHTVLVGGDRLSPQMIARVRERYPALEVINGYGPTENTTFSLTYHVGRVVAGEEIPIGKPLDNRTAFILSPAGRLTPIGAIGELCVGGAGLAEGYWQRDALTAERFREIPGLRRLYFTGDLASWTNDGNVRFIGRKDDQVKIRGYRVEPGEIARILEQALGVEQALVVVKESAGGNKRLVAYATGSALTDNARLLEYLSEQLPEYMVPYSLIVLDAWPLTPNGKVDKDKLPADEETTVRDNAPMGELEASLAAIWSEVLETAPPAGYDNFFDLGGHSLLAIRVISAIRKQLKVELGIRELFDHPTVAGLAAVIRQRETPAAESLLKYRERPAELPLSFSQERIWFIDKLQGSLAYHIPWRFDVEGPLDISRLEAAFGSIVQRHEILRTVVRENQGIGVQVIMPAGSWKMNYAADIKDLETFLRNETIRPFDLSADFTLRATLVRIAQDKYQLLVLFHHIAFDGWSISIFVKELLEAYRSADALPALPLQYAEYAIWQRQYLSGEVLREKQAYWKKQLASLDPLQLPTDKPRPAHQDMAGNTISYQLDRHLQEQLTVLARQEDATLFMTLLAAFNVLLCRYSGQQDICVGTPVAGRDQQELEALIGFFVNTVPLRNTVDGNLSFNRFLQQVKSSTLNAYEHQDIPFEKIVEVLDINRNSQFNPVFQVMFSLQNVPAPANLLFNGIRFIPTERQHRTALFDLSLDVLAGDDGLHLTMNYSTALFREATILRMLKHFEQLLLRVTQQPDIPLAQLDILTANERALLLDVFRSPLQYKQPLSFLGQITHQLQTAGMRTAVLHNEHTTSYAALESLTGRIAASLYHQHGIRKGDKVVVRLPRSERLAATIIALWRCGAVYVPVDAELPEDRMRYINDDVRPAYVITETFFGQMQERDASTVNVEVNPDDDAYIIYTSGSTGLPKGVVLKHGGLDNLFTYIRNAYAPLKDVCMPFIASPGFDISLFQLFTPLIHGGTSLVVDKETMQEMDKLVQLLQQATFLDTVPGVYNLIADHILQHRLQDAFLHVERLFIGGDAIPDQLLQRLATIFKNAEITVTYGPTEATIFCTDITYPSATLPSDARGMVIGKPLQGIRIYILDNAARLQPIGVEGEICIGGPGVAAGYLNNQALTAEKFISDPYGVEALYRTGDVGRWMADGNIAFCGRNDRQLKIRGNRIEPGEIENRLKQQEGIRDAVVQLCDTTPAGAQLVAFYTGMKTDQALLTASLRGFFADSVIPAHFIHLPLIPLTSNGKIDHKALQDQFNQLVSGESASKYVPAGNETELMLVEIWEELLQRASIGIYDNFFQLGGHSLLAIRMIAAVRKRSARELHVRDLFEYPTIAGLAVQLDTIGTLVRTQVLEKQVLPEYIPLSFAQERLWFIDRLQGSLQYHMPWHFRLQGTVDAVALESAFRCVLERHEILRTVIKDHEGTGYQLVRPVDGWKLEKAVTFDEDHFRAIEQTTFDLSSDYMLRATLTALPDGNHILSIVLHHIAFDGWSAGILLKELVAFYDDPAAGLLPLPVQYADYAIWQRNYLSGALLEARLSYWKEKLANVEPLLLSTDHPRSSEQRIRGGVVSGMIAGAVHEQLLDVCRKEDVTIFMTTLAVFNVLLYRYTGKQQICVGTPVAGRDQQETESLLGFFVNTLAINTELPAGISFRALLQRVRQTVIDDYGHQEVPFEKVVEALGLERDMSRNPVFQVMLALQHASDTMVPALGGARVEPVQPVAVTSLFDLTLNVTVAEDALKLDLVYCADLFEEATMRQLLLHYERLFAAALSAPDTSIEELELLSPEEKKFLLEDLNDTATPYPADKTLVDLLAEQALRTPDQIAVEDEHTRLTYRELDELTNRFGHYLRRAGVQEETLVPICLDRSVNMSIGILAILKAGGAYVPMDPGYPVERLNYMLSDMQAGILVTMNEYGALFQLQQQLQQVRIDDLDEMISDCAATPVQNALQPRHAAYMIYTSGSTGQPKGVVNEHTGIVNRLLWTQEHFGLDAGDAVLQKTTFCFDVSVWELFWPLIAGARLVFARPGGHKDPSYLAQVIKESRITTIHFVPSMLAAFLEDLPVPVDLGLKRILCSGEALQANHITNCQEQLPGVGLFNLYGPTEAAVDVTCWEAPAGFSGITVPIGKPVANTQLYVMDTGGGLVSAGMTGELYIGGVQVARGYHNKPVLTMERFIPDTFSKVAGAMLYRTGDIVRWLPDGNLAYMGRSDDQLKIRGHRIEPGEVEAVILASQLVDHIVITSKPDAQGNALLVGYIVPSWRFERDEFIFYMRKNLPGYMIPSLLVKLDELPLTANGKLNRKALPEPDKSELLTGRYIAPRNRTEKDLAAIWRELVQVEQVGINDNFFELGGHSIIMMQVINRMKKLGYQVQLKDLFLYQTVSELAAAVGTANNTEQVTHEHLVTLHEQENGPYCFIIPGSDGLVNNYNELAETFGRQGYQVFGIQQMGIYEDETPLSSMKDIADFNLQLIQQVQSQGPYRIIGHSLGGIIVYELVKRLEASGEKVEFALMLDARPHLVGFGDQQSAVGYVMHYVNDIIARYVADLQYADWQRQIVQLLSAVPMADIARQATRFLRERIPDVAENIDLHLLGVRITTSLLSYQPTGKVNGSLLLMNAAEASHNGEREIQQWQSCIPNLQIFTVPGSHVSMIHKEHADGIYSAFEQSLKNEVLNMNEL